jgi:hypothetical protein
MGKMGFTAPENQTFNGFEAGFLTLTLILSFWAWKALVFRG